MEPEITNAMIAAERADNNWNAVGPFPLSTGRTFAQYIAGDIDYHLNHYGEVDVIREWHGDAAWCHDCGSREELKDLFEFELGPRVCHECKTQRLRIETIYSLAVFRNSILPFKFHVDEDFMSAMKVERLQAAWRRMLEDIYEDGLVSPEFFSNVPGIVFDGSTVRIEGWEWARQYKEMK